MIISVIFVLLFLAFLMGIILLSVVLGVHVSTGGNTGES